MRSIGYASKQEMTLPYESQYKIRWPHLVLGPGLSGFTIYAMILPSPPTLALPLIPGRQLPTSSEAGAGGCPLLSAPEVLWWLMMVVLPGVLTSGNSLMSCCNCFRCVELRLSPIKSGFHS